MQAIDFQREVLGAIKDQADNMNAIQEEDNVDADGEKVKERR